MNKEAHRLWLRGLQRLGCFVVLGAVVMSTGCGGGGSVDPEAGMSDDEKQIRSMVSSLADYASRTEKLREFFTSANAPSNADAAKYKDFKFRIISDVNISGTTATFEVEITSYAETSTAVTKNWKAVKEGDKWKLSETPLP